MPGRNEIAASIDDLQALGMSDDIARLFRESLVERSGLLIVAGAAGSGRRTTIGAGLRLLKDDPTDVVELEPEAGKGFGERLRAALDRDPDLVAIGQLGDREAVELALDAAAAGHLLLAHMPSGRAVGAIARLLELGAEPFMIASTLRAVFAQRLVPRICRACRVPVQATGSIGALLGFDPGAVIYEAQGCDACQGSGLDGRLGLFEAIRVDPAIRRLINSGGDEAVIASHAFRNAPDLAAAARALAREGAIRASDAVQISRDVNPVSA